MRNKVVLITGASGGLGTTVTEVFLDAGARVAGVSRSIKDPESPNPNFLAVPAEIGTVEAARAVTNAVVAKWSRVDALIHLVGGFAGGTKVADTDDDALQRMFDVNLLPAFHMIRTVLPGMREHGGGRILAIGARAAVEPVAGIGAYSASKAALVSLIRTVALENKDHNISANVILPGTIDTPANRAAMPSADVSKWVHPRQIARMLLNLAGDDASQVTGAVIPVYGRGL
jgi:NAD(P)-dependent dehydrogenase (short-subunit alcohol dehydrogenase family)